MTNYNHYTSNIAPGAVAPTPPEHMVKLTISQQYVGSFDTEYGINGSVSFKVPKSCLPPATDLRPELRQAVDRVMKLIDAGEDGSPSEALLDAICYLRDVVD